MSVETPFKQKQKNETPPQTPSSSEEIKSDNLPKILEELLLNPDIKSQEVHTALFIFLNFTKLLLVQFESQEIDISELKQKTNSFFEQEIKPLQGLSDSIKIEVLTALKRDRIAKNKNSIIHNS